MKIRFNYLFIFLLSLAVLYSCNGDDDSNTGNESLLRAKQITKFVFNAADNDALDENITGVINEDDKTITAQVPYGTDVTSLIPTIEISNGATISPEGAQDFSSPADYVVTAQDNSQATYIVDIMILPNDEKQIISFSFFANDNTALNEDVTAIINEEAKTITANVPFGTDISDLTPTIDISENANIDPGSAQNFSSPVEYTVTAEDGSEIIYTVSVQIDTIGAKKILSFQFLAVENDGLNENVIAVIDEENKTISAEVPFGTAVTSLFPTIVISAGATVTINGIQDFTNPVIYTVTAQDESTQAYTVSVTILPNDKNEILNFSFLAANNTSISEDVTGVINQENKTISVVVATGTDITSLTPNIEISENATVNPQGVQDFSSEVVYTVTAENGSEETYTATVTFSTSSDNKILSFQFTANNNSGLNNNITAEIDEENNVITALVPFGTDVSSLLPTIQISEGASITPEGSQDFSSPISYTVKSGNGSEATYTVSVNISANAENKILAFSILAVDNFDIQEDIIGIINHDNLTITAEIPFGTDVNFLWPSIQFSEGATLTPQGGENFSTDVVYTVTAQNGNTANYTVTLIEAEDIQRRALVALYNANPGNTLNWNINDPDHTTWEGVGYSGGTLINLNLQSKNITTLPVEIKHLKFLRDLDLSNNSLTSLPGEFAELKELRNLHLPRNNFNHFPTEITQLTELTTLYMSNNQITSIPSGIGQLTKLIQLHLSYNELTTVPGNIGQLTNLTHLLLHNNKLTSLPAEIGALVNLYSLSLSLNNLTSIPQEVCNLETLYDTDISTDFGLTCQ